VTHKTASALPKPKSQPSENSANHIAFANVFASAHEFSDFQYVVQVTRQSTVHHDISHTKKLVDVKPEEVAHMLYHSKELAKTKDKEDFINNFKSQISVVNNRTIENKEQAAKRKREQEEEAEEEKILQRAEQRKQVRCDFVFFSFCFSFCSMCIFTPRAQHADLNRVWVCVCVSQWFSAGEVGCWTFQRATDEATR
jgi:hypothetical protein